MKNTLILLVVSLIILGCQEIKQDNVDLKSIQKVPKEQLQDSVLRIFIDANIKAKDTFQLHYYTSKKNDTIPFYLRGSKNQQRITFELPKEIIPSKFRIFLGHNKSNLKSKINRIIINYNKNRIVIKDSALAVYFKPSPGLNFKENSFYIERVENTSFNGILETKTNLQKRITNKYNN